MEPEFLKYIKNDQSFLEREPMEILTKKKQLIAFKHKKFWQCMDTVRDMENLNITLSKNNYFE
jgi:glucose-1-phosphate cytidylyltransferase